ncbi:hypothetical protein SAMN05660413_03266 [Salegentibacter flavus]|uniref:Uncharacterized protein n=1 Tax=Salegentibacter flavus TaxID=287099 RepID=A0A1I5DBT5_9FLAO|nr:hypothetical protein SAMN05660413_03266 [Salegentibacter flavus]
MLSRIIIGFTRNLYVMTYKIELLSPISKLNTYYKFTYPVFKAYILPRFPS